MENKLTRRSIHPPSSTVTKKLPPDTVKPSFGKTKEYIFYAFSAALYIFIYFYDAHMQNSCPDPSRYYSGHDTFGGRGKYLTYINLCLLLIYYHIAFIANAISYGQSFIDWLFLAIMWPLSWVVCLFFWVLYALDRNFIHPAHLDEYLPAFLNHFWHTLPLLMVLLEVFLIRHKAPKPLTAVATIFTISCAYFAWLCITWKMNGKWAYPFLQYFDVLSFVLFVVSSSLLSGVFYIIGKTAASWRLNY